MGSQQEDVYESIGDVSLSSLRQGFNSTILAYGQTGSGKTFSMEVRGLVRAHPSTASAGCTLSLSAPTRRSDLLLAGCQGLER